jgi:hypothetical protein
MKLAAVEQVKMKFNSISLKGLYKNIIVFEWFAVAGLTSWLLLIFTTILH